MPTVTVPGGFGSGQYATISLQFQTQANANLAMQLLGQIYTAAAPGAQHLGVQNDTGAFTHGKGTTTLNEYTLGEVARVQNSGADSGAVPAAPSVGGPFLGIADAWTTKTATITGGFGQTNESVVAGGGLTFFTNGGAGTVISGQGGNVVAGQGGGDWNILFDGGNNTVFAGSGNYFIDDGSSSTNGVNLIFLGGNDTVVSWGTDVIVAAPGETALVATFRPGSVFFGNTGPSTYINAGGADTFVAGGGNDTVFAAAGGGTYFGNKGTLLFVSGAGTSPTVSTGAGNATVFGNTGSNSLIFLGPGHDLVSGVSESQTVIAGAGSGSAQIFGNNGDNITFFSPISGNLLVAGPGNVTLNGGGASGANVFVAGPSAGGSDSIVAGSGSNTLVGGPGTNTLVGGNGANVFDVTKAFASGGTELLANFNSTDKLDLFGFGKASKHGLPAGAKVTHSGGSETITLADGTKITFVGVNHVPHSQIGIG